MSQPLHFCAYNANLLCEIPFKRRLTFEIAECTFTEAHGASGSLELNIGLPGRLVEKEDIKLSNWLMLSFYFTKHCLPLHWLYLQMYFKFDSQLVYH